MKTPLHAALFQRLSFDAPDSFLARVTARYGEPHRRYHDGRHILACFDARDLLTDARLPEVDLALLFHDAVYEPLAEGNEAASAELLLAEGRDAWMSEPILRRAMALVLETAHLGEAADDSLEASLVLDADLSVLGGTAEAFEAYEREVREEFAIVPREAYAQGRSQVLRGFLARPSIFATRRGQRLWESRARDNLARSVSRLSSGQWDAHL